MTDIKWGTLLWFNSPAKISCINRPRLVSAAYAAFRPSSELNKKINSSLISLVEKGSITPEQCYLLKASPVAQRLFARKTANDPENYVDSTTLEILQEIGSNAFIEGSQSRQNEIDMLNAQIGNTELLLAMERQKSVITNIEHQLEHTDQEISRLSEDKQILTETINDLTKAKETINTIINKKVFRIRIFVTVLTIVLAAISIAITVFCNVFIGIASFIIPIPLFLFQVWKLKKFNFRSVLERFKQKHYNKQCSLRRFSNDTLQKKIEEKEEITLRLSELENKRSALFLQLKEEEAKTSEYSVDISLLEL